MPTPLRVRNPRGEMIEPPEVSASDAKNGFGRILERVAREGGVTITRRHEPIAVVIPVETYRRLAGGRSRQPGNAVRRVRRAARTDAGAWRRRSDGAGVRR